MTHTGTHLRVEQARLSRLPEPTPPIYFGGSSAAAGPVAVRHSDVYLSWGEPPAQVAGKLAWIRESGLVDIAKAEGKLAGQSPLPLPRDLGLERTGHIPRHADLDRPDVGEHSLTPAAVAAVPAVPAGRVVLVVADRLGDLAFQPDSRTRLVSCCNSPPSPVSFSPSPRARFTSIEINCSSVTAPADLAAGSCSTMVPVVIWRLSLDQQIRRYLYNPDRVASGWSRPPSIHSVRPGSIPGSWSASAQSPRSSSGWC